MRFSIEPRGDHLYACLHGRQTGEEMKSFLVAVHAACGEHKCPRILMSIRASRPVFKPEEYGIATYVQDLVTPSCQVALVGDTRELNAAHEYIEVCARHEGMNVRAFNDDLSALRWLRAASEPNRRYNFSRVVLQGAPQAPGIYSLWEGDELVYCGRSSAIRASLLEHLERSSATHYSWEVCPDPAAREAELLREHERIYGCPPRENVEAS
jgi:hypothetical protein